MPTLDELIGSEEAAPAAGGGTVSLDTLTGNGTATPDFMSRLGTGIKEGAMDFLPALGRQAIGTAKGAYKLGTDAPENLWSNLGEIGRGAASAATFGAYKPEGGDPNLQALGQTGIDLATGKYLWGPLVGKIASPLIRSLMQPAIGGALGGVSAGVQGGDIATGIGQGIGGGVGGEMLGGAARGAGYVAGVPYRQAVSKMARTEAELASRMAKYGKATADVEQVVQRNKAMMQAYEMDVAAAQAAVAAGVPGAKQNLAMALDTRNRLQADFDASVKGAADEAQKLRPALAPAQAYAEFNRVRDTAPQTLPDIELKITTTNVGKQANRIIASSENLPRQAGIGAIDPVEKLAVGLDSAMKDTAQAVYDPGVIATFGEKWKNFDANMKQLANEKYTAQIGISGDDIASMSSGRLRLDQFDRMRKLVGEKAGAGSGLASSIYWSLMEDLRSSVDPMAKGYIEANRGYSQNIAAMDLTRKVLPARDKYNNETIDARKLSEVSKMFDIYKRDPKLLKFDERQIVESIPLDQRQPFLDYIDTIFKKRSAADMAGEEVKLARKQYEKAQKVKPAIGQRPKLASTEMPDLSTYGPLEKYPDMQFDSPLGFGATYSLNRAAGLPISWSILAAHGLGTIAAPIFRLGLSPEGRQFAKAVFMDGPPKWGDKAKLMAVQNFLQAQDFNEERKRKMREFARQPQRGARP